MQHSVQSLIAFVAVGQTGAFVRAAKQLGVSPSVISHHIAKLEDQLGETLVHRTTRKLTLSENGKRLFEAAQAGLTQIDLALEQARSDSDEVAGALRIALPAFVPDPVIETRIMEFATRYQNVALTLDYSDDVVDLVAGGYDLSIRLGNIPTSSLIRRRIGSVTHLLVATPEILLEHGTPINPSDLTRMPTVAMSQSGDRVTLMKGDSSETVSLETSRIKIQNILGVRTATRSGLGFGNLPEALVREDVSQGRLESLLPDWHQPQLTLQAVWSGTSHRRELAHRFVEWIVA
jgi:DNA-binding transcriptional LysR family regulator